MEERYIPRGKRYWIPVLGWVLLQTWSMKNNARRAVSAAVIQFLLLVIPAVLFFALAAEFASLVVYRDALLLIAASSLFFIAGTVFEVNYVDGHRQTAGSLSRFMNWDFTREMPRNEIRRMFLSSNYHELVLAIVGTVLGVALRHLC